MTMPSPRVALALLALPLIAAGCARRAESPVDLGRPVAWESREHLAAGGTEPADSARAGKVELRWVEFTSAPTDAARDSLNDAVRRWTLASLEGPPLASADSLASRFLDGLRTTLADIPDMPGRWFLVREVKVELDTVKVVALAFSEFAYTGGAHPNTALIHRVYDAVSGRRLRLDEIVRPEARDSLTRLAERAFRAARDLEPAADLGEAGFWFKDGRFALNDEVGARPEGLVFRFNPYEVAPYSMGATEFTVPWAEAGPLHAGGSPFAGLVPATR
jgi:hypothetical protein